MKSTIELNESNFEREVLQSTRPVVVDFWAEWCGPCKMLAPVLDEIARELDGQAVIAKVNVDEQPELTGRFSIQSIPTLVYFQGGEVRDVSIGAVTKKTILGKISSLLAAAPAAAAESPNGKGS
jgi:thioredoxin 1